jgi:hypothetical protein
LILEKRDSLDGRKLGGDFEKQLYLNKYTGESDKWLDC